MLQLRGWGALPTSCCHSSPFTCAGCTVWWLMLAHGICKVWVWTFFRQEGPKPMSFHVPCNCCNPKAITETEERGRCSARHRQQLPSAGSLRLSGSCACRAARLVRGEWGQEHLVSAPPSDVSICSKTVKAWLALVTGHCQQAFSMVWPKFCTFFAGDGGWVVKASNGRSVKAEVCLPLLNAFLSGLR